jgi:DNA mismatch endonuclease (patch repair protein)
MRVAVATEQETTGMPPKANRRQMELESPSSATRRRMQATRQRDTPREVALRSALHQQGFRFRVDSCIPGTRRRPDIVFGSLKIAVFVDGCYWHGCPKHATWPKTNAEWWRTKIHSNIQRDRNTDDLLAAQGWKVLRFWEHEETAQAAAKVIKAIASRRRNVGQWSRVRRS